MKMRIVLALVILLTVSVSASAGGEQSTTPLHRRSFVWYGQFLALDETARIATISARIPPHVEKYVGRFKTGEQLVLVWDMIGRTEADRVLAVWELEDDKKSGGHTGYVLPIEFVSADLAAQTMTFKLAINGTALKSLTSAKPGEWIKVVTPMVQTSQTAVISSIELTPPPPREGPLPSV